MTRIAWRTGIIFVVVLSLIIGLMPTAGFAGVIQWEKVDPALRALMERNTQATWPVIVEAANQSVRDTNRFSSVERANRASERVRASNGETTGSLGIIGSAIATANYSAIAALSRDPLISYIYHDAPVRPLDSNLGAVYPQVIDADNAWNAGYTGKGIGIAVLDSGINANADLVLPTNRIVARADLVGDSSTSRDSGGHGTHVAGIIAGSGYASQTNATGMYRGIAPGANLIDVRVLNSSGSTSISTVVKGVQWVVRNRDVYNIRVLNLSLGAVVPATYTYRADALVAALNVAWLSGIVVVSAAGNAGPGSGSITTPGTDPMLMTVGALDDNGTKDRADDSIPRFSSRGPTPDGLTKPDLIAPGRRIVSLRSPGSYLDNLLPDRIVYATSGSTYFRLTGTSMAAPVVSGVVALLLQKNPSLKPDQVKYILTRTTRRIGNYDANSIGAGVVNAQNAIRSNLNGRANQNKRPADAFARSVLALIKGQPLSWRDPRYGGRNWANVTWDNLTWDNITWDNLMWDNITWDNLMWDNITWDNLTWDNLTWDNITWDASSWPDGGDDDTVTLSSAYPD